MMIYPDGRSDPLADMAPNMVAEHMADHVAELTDPDPYVEAGLAAM
jgi:hypothetical protein